VRPVENAGRKLSIPKKRHIYSPLDRTKKCDFSSYNPIFSQLKKTFDMTIVKTENQIFS